MPVSLKDCIDIEGYDSTVGLTALAFKPRPKNSTIVDMLLSLGAIIYVKTTTPQGLLAMDTHSALWGRTYNPMSRTLTAGGSSGGEGALISMRGSILGIGTDLGGSIRLPAMCCGIYGFKPSSGLIPVMGTENGHPSGSQMTVQQVVGPLATSLRSCHFLLHCFVARKPWELDPTARYSPMISKEPYLIARNHLRKWRIGVIYSDETTPPSSAVTNALRQTVQVLSCSGIAMINLNEGPEIRDLLRRTAILSGKGLTMSGNEYVFSLLESTGGEPWSPWLKSKMKGPRPPKDIPLLWQFMTDSCAISKDWMDKVWARFGLDMILCPVSSHTVCPHDSWNGLSYTSIWNLLDYPATV